MTGKRARAGSSRQRAADARVDLLLRWQHMARSQIEGDLSGGRKVHHWIWYVFPTQRPGEHDPAQTYVANADEARQLLARDDASTEWWASVLRRIAEIGPKAFLSLSDGGRMRHFLREWREHAQKWRSRTRAMSEFVAALERLKAASDRDA